MNKINQDISNYLTQKREGTLERINSKIPKIIEIRDEVSKIDLKRAENIFYQQLLSNSSEYWPRHGSELDGLYFEIVEFNWDVVMADVYGIISNTLKKQSECYMLGYEYDFGERFDRVSGVELDENPIGPLYGYNDNGQEKGYSYDPSFRDLEASYFLSFSLALHNALSRFVETEAFLCLRRKKPFHFLIAIHDDGPAYPLWIDE